MAIPGPAQPVPDEITTAPKVNPMPRRLALKTSAAALLTLVAMNLIPELGGVQTAYAGVKYCGQEFCCNCSAITTRCYAWWARCGTSRVVVDYVVLCSGDGCAHGWLTCLGSCVGPFRCCSYTCYGCPSCCSQCPH